MASVYDKLSKLDKQPAKKKLGTTKSKKHAVTIVESKSEAITTQSRPDLLDEVRQAIRKVGKENCTHRLTIDEKRALAQLIFSYGEQGIRTSATEITRIAINYMVQEHKRKKQKSILHQVLTLLHE